MIRKLKMAPVIAAAVVAAAGLLGAAPASAATPEPGKRNVLETTSSSGVDPLSPSQCPANRFCVWQTSPFSGHFAYFAHGSVNLEAPIGGFVFNNKSPGLFGTPRRRENGG